MFERLEIKNALGVDFILRSNSVDCDNLDWMSQSFFIRELFETRLTDSDFIIDLGSHIGTFAIPAVWHKRCRGICFEPNYDSLKLSKANAALNGVDQLLDLHQCAVGGSDGTVLLQEADQNWGHTIIKNGGPNNKLTGVKHRVKLVSLNTILQDIPATSYLFLKFNIEGAEFEMFRHASHRMLTKIGCLVGEVHYDLGKGDFQPCVKQLNEAGFQVNLIPQGDVRAILIARRAELRMSTDRGGWLQRMLGPATRRVVSRDHDATISPPLGA
jgi:FkbM family methyltransferase